MKNYFEHDLVSNKTFRIVASIIIVTLLTVGTVNGERIKDIVDIQGVRGNPINGIGLVVGLAGTGDTSLPSRQIMTNLFRDFGLVLNPEDFTGGNNAVVMVTAELGPYNREGSRLDVDVSSIGDAKSLQGGMLLATQLEGLDGQVYAIAQGGVSIGGWSATGKQATVSKNHATVGRIPGGAIVEKTELATFLENIAGQRFITLNLRNSDFSTAERIRGAINLVYANSAIVIDAGTVKVSVPQNVKQSEIAGFIDNITAADVIVDVPAVVVINERTGTIVVGENVGISTVAISQGSLVVKVRETARVSQPNAAPFGNSAGNTEVIPETLVGVEEREGYLIPVERSVTVSELAKTLNAIGASPRDLIAIFNALKEAGALQAQLKIM